MEGSHFDRLTRAIGTSGSRRTGIRLAIGLLVGRAGLEDAHAAPRQVICNGVGRACTRHGQCCSGRCNTGRDVPRNQRNRCRLVCGPGLSPCGDRCIDLQSDTANCGWCAHACSSEEQCIAGRCQCARLCAGKDCGDDGCGGTCGTCTGNDICDAQQQCTCVPDCTGKTCGSDGCGGFCGTDGSYGCWSGETCAADGVTCTTGCSSYADVENDNWSCEASTEFETFIITRGFDLDPVQCDTRADCTMFGMCGKADYECYCERAWNNGGYDAWDSAQGWCYYVRTVTSPCTAYPFTGPQVNCMETIEGEFHFYVSSTDQWDGSGQSCSSDAECIAYDSSCNDPGVRCVCGLEGYVEGTGYADAGRQCAMLIIDPGA